MSTVSWVLAVNVKDGDAFRTVMHDMVESTRQEPGALVYEWFGSEGGDVVHISERYQDSDAVMAHLGAFGANFAARFMGAVEPIGMWVYGDPSDAVREALGQMGAEYLGPIAGFAR